MLKIKDPESAEGLFPGKKAFSSLPQENTLISENKHILMCLPRYTGVNRLKSKVEWHKDTIPLSTSNLVPIIPEETLLARKAYSCASQERFFGIDRLVNSPSTSSGS